MSAKKICLVALTLSLLGVGLARGQGPVGSMSGPVGAPPAEPGQALAVSGPGHVGRLSSWITYARPECCGPFGDHVPMRYELYLMAGPSIPVGGDVLDRTLETGWMIEGGGRLLFFNQELSKAWTVGLSLANVHNNGDRPDIQVPIFRRELDQNQIPPVSVNRRFLVSVRALNRTFVNLSGGREWYLIGDGSGQGPAWRFGIDGGGSWGTSKVEFTIIQHSEDVIGRAFAALHSHLEVPRGCCTFLFGARAEWAYTWSSVLQTQNDGEVMDLNLLATIGVRF